MSETSDSKAAPSRRGLWLALGGCALLLVCGLVVTAGGLGAWLFQNRRAQPAAEQPAVEYVLDASPRMSSAAEAGGTRLAVAQGVLAEIVRPADPDLTAGLRVFGTGAQAGACLDTDLLVPLAPSNQTEISSRVLEVATGAAADAAVGEAMLAAIRDLSTTAGPHTLVVITGGADTCNAEAGQLIAQEAERAGTNLQTFVIGYLVADEEAEAIRGLVEDVGDGSYYEASGIDELRAILVAIQKYVDDPTTTFPSVTLGTPAPVVAGPEATAAAQATAAAVDPNNPDPTQAVAPGETPVDAASYVAQSACDHPYFPLRQGATWAYRADEYSYTWTVIEVTGDLQNAAATMRLEMTDFSIDYHWTCDSGGLVSYDYGSANASGLGEGFTFEVTSASGAWLLPAEQLVPGAAWESAYTMESSMAAAGQDISVVTSVNESYTVAGFESSTTEAGTFDTVRIDSSGHYQSDMAGLSNIAFDTSNTVWFAYGVGMVRQESTSSGESTTTTLVSYSIPQQNNSGRGVPRNAPPL